MPCVLRVEARRPPPPKRRVYWLFCFSEPSAIPARALTKALALVRVDADHDGTGIVTSFLARTCFVDATKGS
jgi:hypothetical protein